jgi:hypothetical protein
MDMSNRDFLGFIKRLRGQLAIGQILREEFLYEVHGPFVAVAPGPSPRSFSRRLTGWLSALTSGLTCRSRLRRRATL